jgi:prolyl-tRNA editing enzyme YbaK/EbsC (Cys-tRNA(Pro) deacylase)
MQTKFKVKLGAITPFGTIHKLEVFADKSLAKMQHAIFQAGSFTESLRLKMKDYLKSENVQTGDFGKKK